MPPATGGKLAFSRTQTQEQLRRTVTFAERTAYQYAIEEVYWRHRIWPKENPGPKPPLDAIVSQRQIEQKVEEYLRKSQLVADRRGSPITGSELQTEMERMANHTREPEVLGELFEALGNDPFVIAECLAKPILAERLVSSLGADGGAKALAGSSTVTSEIYKLPEISSVECADSWTSTTIVNAPAARQSHSAVWTGSEMIIWGGGSFSGGFLDTGGRYYPSTDSWTATSTANAPANRFSHTAVWTGSEMIVWGGYDGGGLDSGGKYNPSTDSWVATSTVNAAIVEPVFANLRSNKRLDRFTYRGSVKVNIQWLLYCLVHNIEKIAHYGKSYRPKGGRRVLKRVICALSCSFARSRSFIRQFGVPPI
jgi:hypothetical protein